MKKLTTREKQVLIELLKNSKTSDQEIARKLKTSRPTVFNIRKRLEKNGLIKKYLSLIDFEEIGLCLQAVILYRWKDYSKTKEFEKTINFIRSLPQVVLFAKGEGMGSKTDLIISLHQDLKDYEKFMKNLKTQLKDNVENIEIFLSSVNNILRGYDFSSVAIQKIQKNITKNKSEHDKNKIV